MTTISFVNSFRPGCHPTQLLNGLVVLLSSLRCKVIQSAYPENGSRRNMQLKPNEVPH